MVCCGVLRSAGTRGPSPWTANRPPLTHFRFGKTSRLFCSAKVLNLSSVICHLSCRAEKCGTHR
jgi:hypothetical protein